MYPERSKDIIYTAKHFLQIPDMSIFNAVNGSEKDLYQKTISEISLYTRYTMSVGRNDHMQLSNVGMLGCLLSHVEVWKRVQPGETIAIFEDDSIIDTTSSERMYNLFYDLRNIEWDILMLESGQPMISQGSWKNIGLYASTCAKSRIKIKENIVAVENDEYNNDKNNYTEISNATTTTTTTTFNDTKLENDGLEWIYDGDIGSDYENSYKGKDEKICTWFGTRGYLLTYNGAQILLKHIFPITVQVDSFIGLVAAFDSNFKMFWTRQNVVHWRYSYLSHVWEHCFKCYMPIDAQFYIIFIIIILLSVFIIIFRHRYDKNIV
jgi:GR25 family glycosyltransferase involved in LPS biosynthesis